MPPTSLVFESHASFDTVDQQAFAELIKDGFGKQLVPGYFEQAHPLGIYLAVEPGAERYVGGAVVEPIPTLPSVQYLDKLVVAQDKQGNGVGSTLMAMVKDHHARFVWRADPENPCNPFYQKLNPLRSKEEGWFVYNSWNIGLWDMFTAREYAASKPQTLEEL